MAYCGWRAFNGAAVWWPFTEGRSKLVAMAVGGCAATDGAARLGGVKGKTEQEPLPPQGSKVRIIETKEAIAIEAPPAGVIRGSHGVFAFAVFWTVLSLVFLFFMSSKVPAWPLVFPALLFPAMGIAFILWSVHLGRQRVMMAINAHTVALRRMGPFSVREERYPRADLTAVECGPSGITVNDRPVMELQLHFRTRSKVGCMAHLSEDELLWLAEKLRRWLGLPSHSLARDGMGT